MATYEKSVDVNVPVRTAYNQWTQFEEFPKFMDGVEVVRQHGDDKLFWRAKIAGKEKEWNAKITEQSPDKRIAWTSTSGAHNSGVVTFHYLDDNKSRVTLQMEYEPEGALESAADAVGLVKGRVEGDLKNFKEFIENRRVESGGWRGEINR